MKRDRFERRWQEIRTQIREKWEKLTDADLKQIDGKYEELLEKLQAKYGLAREEAEKQVNEWKWEGEHPPHTYFWRED
jgi:uncharacterized protein YjbJ (UPF0337 family)